MDFCEPSALPGRSSLFLIASGHGYEQVGLSTLSTRLPSFLIIRWTYWLKRSPIGITNLPPSLS